MARLKYDARLVNSTIDELGAASDQLISTEDEMRSALTIIANAQGIHHVHSDTIINTLGYPAACQEMIGEAINTIKARAQEVEEYNEKYENASFLEKLGSTAGLFLTKICEGFASAGEQIVDGFASVLGWGAGLISKDAQDSIANFIKKDHVGDFFGNLYNTTFKDMVIKSWASEKGLACNIFKGVGTGLGYAAALYATGGIAGGLSTGTAVGAQTGAAALMSSLPAAATTAGIAGIGAGTQAGLKGGLDYNSAFGYGIKYGAIQAGTTIVFTYAFKALSKGWNMLKTKMSGKTTTGLTVTNQTGGSTGTGPTGGAPGTAASTVKSGVNFNSPYKGYSCLDDVWDDVVAGKLAKKDLIDILRNTVGLDDGGIGHHFLSDAMNVLGGDAALAATPNWRSVATNLTGNIADDTTATVTNTITNSGRTATAAGVADDTFTSAGNNIVQDAVEGGSSTSLATITDDTITGTGSNIVQDAVEGSSTPSLSTVADDTVANTGSGVVQDAVEGGSSRTAGQLLRDMEKISEGLTKRQSALNAAQQQLDDAIAQGADDSVISALQKKVTSAQKSYDLQLDKLRVKQQAYVAETASGKYNAVGTEKGYKLINGDFVDDAASVGGDVTTLRTQTVRSDGTVEVRPNWTDASARVEGQINPKDFYKYPKTPAPTAPVLVTTPPPVLVTTPPPILVTTPPPVLVTTPPPILVTTPPPIITTPPPIIPKPAAPAGNTIIFGVVEPEPITPPTVVDITPAPVDPVIIPTTAPPIITTAPPIITTVPPIITTAPPIITTAPPIITTVPPIITTAPPIITTAPPIVTQAPIITDPPLDAEYAPIPNTGLEQAHNSKLGVAPVIAAAVGGLASAFGGSLLSDKKKKDKDKEEDIEELDLESEE